jgi:hypothetical protein
LVVVSFMSSGFLFDPTPDNGDILENLVQDYDINSFLLSLDDTKLDLWSSSADSFNLQSSDQDNQQRKREELLHAPVVSSFLTTVCEAMPALLSAIPATPLISYTPKEALWPLLNGRVQELGLRLENEMVEWFITHPNGQTGTATKKGVQWPVKKIAKGDLFAQLFIEEIANKLRGRDSTERNSPATYGPLLAKLETLLQDATSIERKKQIKCAKVSLLTRLGMEIVVDSVGEAVIAGKRPREHESLESVYETDDDSHDEDEHEEENDGVEYDYNDGTSGVEKENASELEDKAGDTVAIRVHLGEHDLIPEPGTSLVLGCSPDMTSIRVFRDLLPDWKLVCWGVMATDETTLRGDVIDLCVLSCHQHPCDVAQAKVILIANKG